MTDHLDDQPPAQPIPLAGSARRRPDHPARKHRRASTAAVGRTRPGSIGSPSPPERLTARSPQDVLALAPRLLGFHPRESIVMLTLGDAGSSGVTASMHARVDLLPPARLEQSIAPLHDAVVRHGVRRVVFLIYAADRRRCEQAWAELRSRFGGVEIVLALWVAGEPGSQHWLDLRGPGAGVADITNHPLLVEAVLQGRVVLGSRAELADLVALDPEAAEPVAAALERMGAAHPGSGRTPGSLDYARAARILESDETPSPTDCARVALALQHEEGRVAVLVRCDRSQADDRVGQLIGVVRACPEPWVGPVAVVLALLAWVAGEGALAWCALDRAESAGQSTGTVPASRLRDLVVLLLEQAQAPSAWDEVVASLRENLTGPGDPRTPRGTPRLADPG